MLQFTIKKHGIFSIDILSLNLPYKNTILPMQLIHIFYKGDLKMINIALFHTITTNCSKLKKYISEYMTKKAEKFTLNAIEFNKSPIENSNNYDLIFLVFSSCETEFIKKAELVRKFNISVPIILLTNSIDKWKLAFSLHAFDYITEPIKAKEIKNVLDDFFLLINEKKENRIVLNTDNGISCINENDICYVIVERKRAFMVHTSKENIHAKGSLTDISNNLNTEMFYQSRRDCIVNMNYVNKIINDFVIVMNNGDMLPLAQKKKADFIQKLSGFGIYS